jgi:uncharacterized protein (DUF3084 family)
MSSDDLENLKTQANSLQAQVNTLQQSLSLLNDKIHDLDDKISFINGQIQVLLNQANTTQLLLKYVVTPLLLIVGGLVGIKLVIPGG